MTLAIQATIDGRFAVVDVGPQRGRGEHPVVRTFDTLEQAEQYVQRREIKRKVRA